MKKRNLFPEVSENRADLKTAQTPAQKQKCSCGSRTIHIYSVNCKVPVPGQAPFYMALPPCDAMGLAKAAGRGEANRVCRAASDCCG